MPLVSMRLLDEDGTVRGVDDGPGLTVDVGGGGGDDGGELVGGTATADDGLYLRAPVHCWNSSFIRVAGRHRRW